MTALAVLTASLLGAASATSRTAAVGPLVPVVVRVQHGAAADVITRAGGRVGRHIGLIDAYTATVPASSLRALEGSPGVVSVSPDAALHLLGNEYGPGVSGVPMSAAAALAGAPALWASGVTGAGVDVALIDSGVAPMAQLDGAVVNGPDLTPEAASDSTRSIDTFGHGTHLAGIIAGRPAAARRGPASADRWKSHGHIAGEFTGIAPGARLVSIKVADANGNTDVSLVLAAIDWAVQNRDANGLHIRVINISFGTDSTQPYALDPLAFATEVAWRSGIVVVAAAGNHGQSRVGLDDPASDPFLIAAGAVASNGSPLLSQHLPAAFTGRGDGVRNPDLLAPGTHLISLASPATTIGAQFGSNGGAPGYMRGSGTSQAAAFVSGAAALLIQQRPSATPDQIKALLTGSATPIAGVGAEVQGAGAINLWAAAMAPTPVAVQQWQPSTGLGSIEASRGSLHLIVNGVPVVGEVDAHGSAFDAAGMAQAELSGSSWSGGSWSGSSWSGGSWSGGSWSGSSWSGSSWSGSSWSGSSWSGSSWSGSSWSGSSWSGSSWSGEDWS